MTQEYQMAGILTVGKDWLMSGHAHDHLEIIVMYNGTLEVTLEDQRIEARAGDVLTYGPGIFHRERSRRAETVFGYVGYRPGKALPAWPAVVADADGRIRLVARWLHEERQAGSASEDPLPKSLAATLVDLMDRAARGGEDPVVARGHAVMRDRLADRGLEVAALAAAVGMSRSHFLRSWKQRTGSTPMADLRRMRVERARDLLLTTDLPLKAIAAAVGCCDQYHLSRLYRRRFGHPPGRTRHTGSEVHGRRKT